MKEPSPFWQSVIWIALAAIAVFASQLPMFTGAKGWADSLATLIVGMVLANHTSPAMRKVIDSIRPPAKVGLETPKDSDPQ